MIAVPVVVAHLRTAAQCQLNGFYTDEIFFAQLSGDFRCGNNGAGRPVAYPAAVEKPQGMGDNRGRHDLVLVDGLAQMGFGV